MDMMVSKAGTATGRGPAGDGAPAADDARAGTNRRRRRGVRLLARFDDRDTAQRAVRALRVSQIPVDGRLVIPKPTWTRRFDRSRSIWAAVGAAVGAVLGGVVVGGGAALLGLDEGVLANPIFAGIPLAAFIGALLFGTLSLLMALAVAEPRAVAEAEDELLRDDAASPPPGGVSLDVVVPDAESRRVQRTLVDAGAQDVRLADG